MPVYSYVALNAKGKQVKGIIDSDTAKAARAKLRAKGIFPTDINEVEAEKGLRGKGLSMEIDIKALRGKVSLRDLAMTTRQLATLAGAGIPLVESIGALANQTEDVVLKKTLSQVREKVNEGSSFANALKDFPKIFSPLFINMVNAGENSGTLDLVLARLADFVESQVELRQKVRSAMIYPILMAVIGTGIVSYLVGFVIPKISVIFEGMDKTLPAVTVALLGVSHILGGYWYIIVALIALGVYLFRRWRNTKDGRLASDKYLLRLPIFGGLTLKIAVSRFARTLATLLKSGVPIIMAMDIVKSVVQNRVLEDAIEDAREHVKEGQSIGRPLQQSGVFPPVVIHMINVGESTGELEDMLFRVADAYESEVDATINGLTSILEPVMLLIMAGFVGFTVLAIMLPIMDMTSVLQ
ncbi:MAG: type II secretion system inner membrane protein GspF [Candidatus Lernaella stagnicola]|nr:type II secretion system inner membrane protein GspF [Candidatus Lernaella stagnicola]